MRSARLTRRPTTGADATSAAPPAPVPVPSETRPALPAAVPAPRTARLVRQRPAAESAPVAVVPTAPAAPPAVAAPVPARVDEVLPPPAERRRGPGRRAEDRGTADAERRPAAVDERRTASRRAGGEPALSGLDALRATVRNRVVTDMGPSLGAAAVDESIVRRLLEQHLDEALRTSRVTVGPTERQQFVDTTLADMLGWGPLTPLMADPGVTEIMVNGLDSVWVERAGRLERVDVHFPSQSSYRVVLDRMLAVAGRRVDEASPMADGRLPDGSRVNVIIPPLVVGDPVLTLRRFPEIAFTVDDLVARGALTAQAAAFLSLCVQGKLNVLVSGGTGTGKTTLLNVLSSSVPAHERVITIEDAAELRLSQPHVVTLEARPANVEGAGAVGIRDLVRNALRMRPDRIVIGEVRGGEALDMLQAMNTGHEGSLTTVHANTPRDALARLETMVLMSGFDLPLRAIREQIASALDVVVQLQRQPDGSRVVSHVTEVQGREGDTVTMQDVFLRRGDALVSTGLRPHCGDRLEAHGLTVPAALFAGAPSTTGPALRRRSR